MNIVEFREKFRNGMISELKQRRENWVPKDDLGLEEHEWYDNMIRRLERTCSVGETLDVVLDLELLDIVEVLVRAVVEEPVPDDEFMDNTTVWEEGNDDDANDNPG